MQTSGQELVVPPVTTDSQILRKRHVLRAVERLAGGNGPRTSHEDGLGARSRRRREGARRVMREGGLGAEQLRRIEFSYTPKHGRWLSIAENELTALTRQCLQRRHFGDLETLQYEIGAWSTDGNSRQLPRQDSVGAPSITRQ